MPSKVDRLFGQNFKKFFIIFILSSHYLYHSAPLLEPGRHNFLWTSPNHSCAPKAWLMIGVENLICIYSDREKHFTKPNCCLRWDWLTRSGTEADFFILAFDSQSNLWKIHLKCRPYFSFNCNLWKHRILKKLISRNNSWDLRDLRFERDLPEILIKSQVRIIKDHHIWKVVFLYTKN